MIALEISNNDVFFESISSISNFTIYDTVWKRYVTFALPKINKAIAVLKQDKHNLKLLTLEEAQLQLKELVPIVVILSKFKEDMKAINETDKQEFITKSLELINEIETTAEMLEDFAAPNHYYNLFCQSSSQDDWNDPLNDHWDKY